MIKNALHRLNNEDVAELLHERENKSPFSFIKKKAYKKKSIHVCNQIMSAQMYARCGGSSPMEKWKLLPKTNNSVRG